jgi:hypothetical protein
MLLMLAGCAMEQGLSGAPSAPDAGEDTSAPCAYTELGFDIEAVSTLENALGIEGGRDAVVLSYDDALPEGATWRVRSVDLNLLIPLRDFPVFADGQELKVQVWEGTDPNATRPWRLSQTFHKGDHVWEAADTPDPTSTTATRHMSTWWTFDLSETVPATGMAGTDYVVAVAWDESGAPALGYSNYNRPCSGNWTNWGPGVAFAHNQGGSSCAWPMLRVEIEVTPPPEECP